MSKKILLVFPISVFPKVMASQDRVWNMVKRFSVDHSVDIATICNNQDEINESKIMFAKYVNNFFPIVPPNFRNKKRILIRIIVRLGFWVKHYLLGYSERYYYWGNKLVIKQLLKIIRDNNYDIVQVHYWYMCEIFKYLPLLTLKVIDTNDVLYKKKELSFKFKYKSQLPYLKLREMKKYKRDEIRFTALADVIVSITEKDWTHFSSCFPNKQHIIIPTGQDIESFLSNNSKTQKSNKVILFYGSLSGEQNIIGVFRLYEKIFPLIKQKFTTAVLLVLGANPPEKVQSLAGEDVIVTGFVDDVKEYLAKSDICILPLETAGGFRGRVVEVMAMNVPVIGTANALESVGLRNGEEGFILESDTEIAEKAIELLSDSNLYKRITNNALDFVRNNYSIENTFGLLSKYYDKYEQNI